MKKTPLFIIYALSSVWFILIVLSCASRQPVSEPYQLSEKEKEISETIKKEPSIETEAPELISPEFIPVKEDISPIQTKIVSISARNTPLRDVLYTITKAINLNLVIERGVDPDLPVTISLNDVPVQDALDIIFNSVDYFYAIKDNVLIIKAVETKIFELGRPGVIQDFRTDIGGDMLGGAASETGGGEIKGDISLKSTSDKVAFQLWDALENSLNNILQASDGKDMPAGSFTVNRMAGTIMVTASKKKLEQVENYIENLKRVLNRQVFIEARIFEVQLSEGLKYGINWEIIDQWKGKGNIDIGAKKFTSVVESTGPNFQIGIIGNNISALLLALQEQGDVKTLSNPRVSILNGQTAMLTVGRNKSFISRVETTTTTTEGALPTINFTVETKSVLSGVMFGLVPYISEEGNITLTITPIISNLVELEPQLIGSGNNTVEIKLPTVDLREMSSTVKLADGEIVVIGGLIDTKEQLNEDKVPLLSDIPVLGHVFKSVDKSYEKTELVITLVPRIVDN